MKPNLVLARCALALSLAFGVVGCADQLAKFDKVVQVITSAKASSKVIVLAIQSFDAAKVGATGYLRLRRCNGTNGPICRDPAVTEAIDVAVQEGTAVRNSLKEWVRTHPDGIGPQDAYDRLVSLTGTISRATAAYNAAK